MNIVRLPLQECYGMSKYFWDISKNLPYPLPAPKLTGKDGRPVRRALEWD